MQAAINGFWDSIRSVRSMLASVGVMAFILGRLLGQEAIRGANLWDPVFGALTDTLVISLILGGWWLTWLVPLLLTAEFKTSLIRYGSPARALTAKMLYLTGANLAFGVLVFCGIVGIGLAGDFAWEWSEVAKSEIGEGLSVFSASTLAAKFTSPVIALAVSTLFTFMGFCSIAIVSTALATIGRKRAALAYAVTMGFWAFICSFSPLDIPQFVDASSLLSLAWALGRPFGVTHAALFWLMSGGVSLAVLKISQGRLSVFDFVAGRRGVVLTAIAMTVLASTVAVSMGVSSSADLIAWFFSGSHGDLASYALVAAIPLLVVTASATQLAKMGPGYIEMLLMRHGSVQRWLEYWWRVELAWAGFYLVIAIATLIIAALSFFPHSSTEWFGLILPGSVAMYVLVVLQLTSLSVLNQFRPSALSMWPGFGAAFIVLGYWPILGLEANFAAPYSMSNPSESWQATAIPTLICALIAAILASLSRWRIWLNSPSFRSPIFSKEK